MNFSRSFKKSYLDFKLPAIMGILNITPDSFSDGGKYFLKPSIAIKNAIKMQKMGADIIDIGCESSRPGANSITILEEIKRLEKELENNLEKLHNYAEKLSQNRKKTAARLESIIKRNLENLNMPDIQFKINLLTANLFYLLYLEIYLILNY